MSGVIDLETLQELREIMEDEFDGLLETFLSESTRQYDAIDSAMQAGDADGLRLAAHSLKGSCGNVGAHVLQQTCAEIESLARAGTLDPAAQLVVSAQGQLDAVHGEIGALR